MKLTPRQRAFAVVAVLSVATLLFDKLFLQEKGAIADPPEPPSPLADALVEPPETLSKRPDASQLLAARLEAIASDRGLDPRRTLDAFAPDAAKWGTHRDEGPGEQQAYTGDHPPDVEAFLEKHELQSVLASGGGGFALIDGERFRRDAVVEGFRLIEIRARSVIFETPYGLRFELSLQR